MGNNKFPFTTTYEISLEITFPHAPKVLSRNPVMWVNKTPILEHPAVLIAIPEWKVDMGLSPMQWMLKKDIFMQSGVKIGKDW